jgi:hypothetical protein
VYVVASEKYQNFRIRITKGQCDYETYLSSSWSEERRSWTEFKDTISILYICLVFEDFSLSNLTSELRNLKVVNTLLKCNIIALPFVIELLDNI